MAVVQAVHVAAVLHGLIGPSVTRPVPPPPPLRIAVAVCGFVLAAYLLLAG